MRTPWGSAPFFRLLLPFCGGIITACVFRGFAIGFTAFLLSILFFSGYFFSVIKPRSFTYGLRYIPGVLVFISLFFLGVFTCEKNQAEKQKDFFASKPSEYVLCHVAAPAEQRQKSFKEYTEIKEIVNRGTSSSASGNLILYFPLSSRSIPAYGDLIAIATSALQAIGPPKNPGEFDYRAYMANRNYFHTAWLDSGSWKSMGITDVSPLWSFVYCMREKYASAIESILGKNDESATAKALLIGDVTDLSPEIYASYSATGTIHILSVSGFHVGIFYLAIGWLLGGFKSFSAGRWSKAFITIPLIWLYCLISGFSPPAIRAASMLSVLVIGEAAERNSNPYNLIALSAFFILLFDPLSITQVGFQMSYAALLGLIWFSPKLIEILTPRNKIVRWLWSAGCISVAAQLATAPLGLLYFHQFPVYFLPANIVISVASVVLLPIGFLFLLVSMLPFSTIASAFGFLLFWNIRIINFLVGFFASLPHSVWEGIGISIIGCVLLYFAGILLVYAITEKNKKPLIVSLSACVLFLMIQGYSVLVSVNSSETRFFSDRNHSVIAQKTGCSATFYCDSSFAIDVQTRKRMLSGYIAENHLSDIKFLPLRNAQFFSVPGLDSISTVYINDRKFPEPAILQLPRKTVLVLGPNIPPFTKRKWEKDCLSTGVEIYDLAIGSVAVPLNQTHEL